MKRVSMAIFAAGVALAQSNPGRAIIGGSATVRNASMTFETRLEPGTGADAGSALSGGVSVRNGVVYRYMADNSQHKYLGYELAIDPVPGTDEFEMVIRALKLGPAALGLETPSKWSALSLSGYPPPQRVRDGDRIQFELMVNPNTGHKLVEYLEVRAGAQLPPAKPVVPAKDFRLEDVQLGVSNLRLFINGKLMEGGGASGGSLWMYLPNRGRYVLSLFPRPELGFQRAGEVRGPEMTFRIGNDDFVLRSSSPIAPGGGAYHIYVHHNPEYRPKGPDEFTLGAAAIESLFR